MFAIGAGFYFCALTGCSVDTRTTTNGRYQMSGDGTRLVDTTTGDVYDAVFNSNDSSTTWVKRPAVQNAVTKGSPQSTVATATAVPPPTPEPTTTPIEPPQAFEGRPLFIAGLDENLHALKSARDEGNLTQDEYSRARSVALANFESSAAQEQIRGWSAGQLHAELAYLAWMKQQGRLSSGEFDRARTMVVASFLPSSPR
jgi:hypothetical protein